MDVLGKQYLLDTADLLIQGLFQFQLLSYNIHLSPVHSAEADKSRFQTHTWSHYLFFLNFTTGFHAMWERIPAFEL